MSQTATFFSIGQNTIDNYKNRSSTCLIHECITKRNKRRFYDQMKTVLTVSRQHGQIISVTLWTKL